MTRKRFIKLLMSYGIQRNAAEAMARMYAASGMPYAEAIKEPAVQWLKARGSLTAAINCIADAWHEVWESAVRAVNQFAAALDEAIEKKIQTEGGAAE